MSRLLCCLRARQPDMGAALSHPQEGEACEGAGLPAAPPTMADVIRERKKKAGGAGLGTLRRRIAAAARRPRENRPDRVGGCEHARLVRATVGSWRLAEVFLVCEELEAGAALRDLVTRAELAREPAAALHADLAAARDDRLWCDVELVGAGWSLPAHRVILAARCTYFRDLLQRYPPGRCRVVLEGACATLGREEVAACLCALYSGKLCCDLCSKYDRVGNSDGDLDIISTENTNSLRRSACGGCGVGGGGGGGAAAEGRMAALGSALGFSAESLHRDMKYLLDSGELSDTRLVFVSEGGGGFRSALELNAHRLLLAARSRFFRGVLSRRSMAAGGSGTGTSTSTGSGTSSVLCVDEKVLPRRFARALLHAAYTDQVDLSLIGRNSSSSPLSTNSTGSGSIGWAGVARASGGARAASGAALEDAFALYEIGRFLEMPIVVQGCEDAIVEALSPETLPQILRWSSAPHASQWVHRQSMRYLRDEFTTIMCSSASGRIPRAALADALASPFLQAGELHALRALLRWAAAQHAHHPHHPHSRPEPNVVWHTAHAQGGGGGGGIVAGVGGRRGAGGRRREASEAALRDTLAPLLPLLRIEHLPPDTDLLHQLVRRGILPSEACERAEAGTADAWLGRGACRPARCFLPYLDEMKALLEDQAVPEAEIARMRRERYLHRIPDTLYMVAAARGGGSGGAAAERGSAEGGGGGGGGAERWCVSARSVRALRVRMRELCGAQPQARALALHRADPLPVYTQIALRAVREMSLPDSCADLLLADIENERERGCEGWQTPPLEGGRGDRSDPPPDCCRSGGGCSAPPTGSRGHLANHLTTESSRAGSCRRELSGRPPDATRPRNRAAGGARLSAAVPDVAMAPNANTHLLTSRDYFRDFRHPTHSDYCGVVLQLDLGDGATHTPRPGSRAQRANALAHTTRHTHHNQGGMSCVRGRQEEDELRAAIELSVMRAYSSLEGAGVGGGGGCAGSWRTAHGTALGAAGAVGTLPPRHRPDLQGGAAAGAGGPGGSGSVPARDRHTPPLHLTPRGGARQVGGPEAEGVVGGQSPRRPEYSLYARHDYRLEPTYGSSGSASRGHSPNNYA